MAEGKTVLGIPIAASSPPPSRPPRSPLSTTLPQSRLSIPYYPRNSRTGDNETKAWDDLKIGWFVISFILFVGLVLIIVGYVRGEGGYASPVIRVDSLSTSLTDVSGVQLSGEWNISFAVSSPDYNGIWLKPKVMYGNLTLSQATILPGTFSWTSTILLNASAVSLQQPIGAEAVKSILAEVRQQKSLSFQVDLNTRFWVEGGDLQTMDYSCGNITVTLNSTDPKHGWFQGQSILCNPANCSACQ